MRTSMSSNERKDERGLVSFMITLIMMMVITLIVIGFTQVVNRNRRITLDRQLSAQAFYAAESGINDVVKQIKTDGYTVQSQTNCTSGYYASKLVYKLNSGTSTDVAYTCVLVNPVVPDIRTQASAAESKVVDIEPSDANSTNLTPIELTFTWSAAIRTVS
jgi:Tfp pilus assembly protein PilX